MEAIRTPIVLCLCAAVAAFTFGCSDDEGGGEAGSGGSGGSGGMAGAGGMGGMAGAGGMGGMAGAGGMGGMAGAGGMGGMAGAGGMGGAGGELTTNGDFEAGDTSGWEFFANDGTFAATMAQANGGLWSGNLVASVPGGGGPPSFPVIKQANIGIGTVQPNSTATISFDLFGSVSGAGGVFFAEFFSELSGGGTSSTVILGGGPLFPTGTWTNYTYNTPTGNDVSGGVTLQLKADCGANPGCTVDAYIDNVSVTVP